MVYPLVLLFPPETTNFSTNGLGALGEATSCEVTEEANGGFELEMVYPVTGKRYNDIEMRSIIFTRPNPADPPQAFRVYEITKPMDGLVTYYAQHISYDLSGIPVSPFSANNAKDAMAGLKSHSVVSHNFEFWTDKTTSGEFRFDAPAALRSCLGGSEGSILDIYKGEYKFDNFRVELHNERGKDRGVTIRYGKNLTDIEQDENNANVFTGVMPYWFDQNDGTLVQATGNVVPTEGTYNYTNILVADATGDFQEKPTPDQLVEWAKKYISDNEIGKPTVSIDVSFEQLERFKEYENIALLERVELFDTVHVEFPKLNISSTAKVSKTVYDCLQHKYVSITVGTIKPNISTTVAQQGSVVDDISTLSEDAIKNATSWITNGRGYMVAIRDEGGNWKEICSLDDPDIASALNVWRWNNGGFGHSSNGYDGPYDTAITQDGQIIADFIGGGTLRFQGKGTTDKGYAHGLEMLDMIPDPDWSDPDPPLIEGSIGRWRYDTGLVTPLGMHAESDRFTDPLNIQKFPNVWTGESTYPYSAHLREYLNFYSENCQSREAQMAHDYTTLAVGIYHGEVGMFCGLDGSVTIGHSKGPNSAAGSDLVVRQTGTTVYGNFTVSNGQKSRVVDTNSYGQRLLYAYETAEPMFGDVGRSETLSDGFAYITFDPIFAETINTDDYHVFLQAESKGSVYVLERHPEGFVVEGDPGTKFSWVVYAKQIDYPNTRLEEYKKEKP